jgi:hypothetical protein
LENVGDARSPRGGNIPKSGVAPAARTCMNQVRQNQPGPPRSACASSEEPVAVVPHAGICEGGVGQSASLPQSAETP